MYVIQEFSKTEQILYIQLYVKYVWCVIITTVLEAWQYTVLTGNDNIREPSVEVTAHFKASNLEFMGEKINENS